VCCRSGRGELGPVVQGHAVAQWAEPGVLRAVLRPQHGDRRVPRPVPRHALLLPQRHVAGRGVHEPAARHASLPHDQLHRGLYGARGGAEVVPLPHAAGEVLPGDRKVAEGVERCRRATAALDAQTPGAEAQRALRTEGRGGRNALGMMCK
jgi:hypothetical protein